MAANWSVTALRYTVANGEPEFVRSIVWLATDGNIDGEVGVAQGEVEVLEGDDLYTKPYALVQEAECLGYVRDSLGDQVGQIESMIARQRAEKENPTKGSGAPPWVGV